MSASAQELRRGKQRYRDDGLRQGRVAEIKGFAMHALTIEDELLTALDLKGILQERLGVIVRISSPQIFACSKAQGIRL